MKIKLSVVFLLVAATALAGFLPLWYDVPPRSNPNDPFNQRPTFTNNIPLATPLPTPVPTVACPSSWPVVSGSTGGWINDTTSNVGITGTSSSNVQAYGCHYSLAMNSDFTGPLASTPSLASGDVYFNTTSTTNLTGLTITAWIYVPAGMSSASASNGAFIFIKTAGYTFRQAPWSNLPSTAGWFELTFPVDALATSGGWAPAQDDVLQIGVEVSLGGTSPNWSGTLYLDSVNY